MKTLPTTNRNQSLRRITMFSAFFFFALLLTRPAAANTFNVNTTNDTHAVDPYAGTGLDPDGNISFRSALETADAIGGSHTVNLPAGTYLITEGEIYLGSFDQDITIHGVGAATTIIEMDAGINQDRILFINYTGAAPNVLTTIDGVTFKNGHLNTDPFGGGAIRAGGPDNVLSVTNCVFDNNTLDQFNAGTTGGAINMSGGGELTITGCTFTNNTNPVSDGGAVYYFLQNFPDLTGSISITNSTFSGNSATIDGSGSGGAIGFAAQGAVSGQSFSVSIQKNTFLNNTAPGGDGGAIVTTNSFGPSGTVNINYNRFVGNSSSGTTTSGLAMNSAAGSVSATNNWWGCNSGPSAAGACNRAAVVGSGGSGTLTASPYLQLKANASPGTICSSTPDNVSTITAGFLSNSSGNVIAAADLDALIGLPVSFTASLGTLSGAQTTIQANGTATVTFTATSSGAGSVNAVVDNVPNNDATAKASITINASATISDQPDNTSVCAGTTATFAVIASGGAPITYQWYLGATALSNGPSGSGSVYGGATSPMLTISNTSAADNAADYNVHVTNPCGTTISNNASLTVNPNPVVTNPVVSTGTIGQPFSQTFTQTGGSGGTTFSTASTLPNGLTLSSSGVLSGTPTQSGSFPIVVKATDVTGCFGNGPTYNLVINACPVITVTNPAVTTGVLGVAFSQSFTQSGGASPVTFSTASSLPPGLSLSSSGVLSGTPSQTGSYNITVTATDANGCTGTGSTYTLTINCPSVVVNGVGNQTVCNNAMTAAVNFSGSPAGVVFNWTNNTPSIGLAANGSGNIASFTATNATSAPVTATITVTAVYTYGSSTCTGNSISFTITVNPQLQMGACSKTDASCNGGSNGSVSAGTVTGSTGTVSYTWKNSSNVTVGTTPTVTGLPAGIYTLTVTDNCSSVTCSVTVGQPSAITGGDITMSPNPTVPGEDPNTIFLGYGPQTVTLTASAVAGGTSPYTKLWSTGSTSSSISVSPTTTTTYTYTITDANGCTRITSFTVIVVDYRCGNNNNKIKVCHNGHEICISPNAVQAHLDHGDELGPCPVQGGRSSTNVVVEIPFKVTVFPNPTSSLFIFQVKGSGPEPKIIRITDITGRVRLVSTIASNRSAITMGNNLEAGIYFAEITQGKNREIVKLVKLY